jgi:hypothetical protein
MHHGRQSIFSGARRSNTDTAFRSFAAVPRSRPRLIVGFGVITEFVKKYAGVRRDWLVPSPSFANRVELVTRPQGRIDCSLHGTSGLIELEWHYDTA